MKKKIIILISFICSINIYSQVELNIEELKISNIKNSDIEIINQSDTLIEQTEDDVTMPIIETLFKLKNISDTVIVIYPKDISLYVSYRYKGELYTNKLKFLITEDNSYYMPDLIKLNSNKSTLIYVNTPIIELGSSLDVKMINTKDFTMFLLEILPTLRFQYNSVVGSCINDCVIKNVIINDL